MLKFYVSQQWENDKFKVTVIQDPYPVNPREWDNFGTMVCWYRNYALGDKHNFSSHADFEKWAKVNKILMSPIYAHEHSGITISLTPFSCQWDSGQVGWIYCERQKILKDFGWNRINQQRKLKIIEIFKQEIKTYDQYLTGDVWGFEIEDPNGNFIDSCWGFYGCDPKENGMWDAWSEEIRHLVDSNYEIDPHGYFLNDQIEFFSEAVS